MADPLRAYPAHDVSPDPGKAAAGESFERRIRRLEDAVAAMQDTQLMEDRVVERVVDRVELYPQLSAGPSLIAGAARMLLPKTIDATADEGPLPLSPAPPANSQSSWLVVHVVDEGRWMLRMLTDYRYHMSWTGRIVLISAIVVGILSWFVISGLPVVGGIFDRIVLIVAAVVTYKSMSREVQRYQELMARAWRRR